MTKKAPNKSKPSKTQIESLVLFGKDENGKPRSARFPENEAELAAEAARAMSLRLAIAATPEHFEFVTKLPVGRLYASGKAFVPNVRQDLYDQLNVFVGGDPGAISTTLRKTWGDLAPGDQSSRRNGL
jgi:hypothetical protein